MGETDTISRQAAIETLRAYFVDNFDYYIEDTKWIDEVLGTVPTVQPTCKLMYADVSDTISRQAAIDALARMMPRSYTPDGSHPADEEIFRVQEVFADCIEALEILPSAQPEIIRCKDCKHRDKYGCCKYWKGLAMGDIPIATDDYDFCSYAKRI